MLMYLDFETYSERDIKRGMYAYAEHESTDILMAAYSLGSGPKKVWIPDQYDCGPVKLSTGTLSEIRYGLKTCQIVAHNANFERAIINNVGAKYGMPKMAPCSFICTAALCASLALPRSLERVAMMLNLNHVKDFRGKKLINKFCKPAKQTIEHPGARWFPSEAPEDFIQFVEYCLQDVETDYALFHRLNEYQLGAFEKAVWRLDSKINARGIPVDIESVEKLQVLIDKHQENLKKEALALTKGVEVTQISRIKEWLKENGVDTETLNKADVSGLIEGDLPADVRRVLEIRQSLGKTSTGKIKAMRECASGDGRVRGTLLYHGATTGRWSGKLIQPQNFPRPSFKESETVLDHLVSLDLPDICFLYGEPMEPISSCLRSLIKAEHGKKLVVADYASIEARVLCWLSGQDDAVDAYFKGADMYISMASFIYGVPESQITKMQRALGKSVILGCGYGMGPATFLKTCALQGIEIDESMAERAVRSFREKYKKVAAFWYDLENAAVSVISKNEYDFVMNVGKVQVMRDNYFLFIKLPSGRKLAYPEPRLTEKKTPWGEMKPSIQFTGASTKTVMWGTNNTYGGKLVENVTQAVARDLTAYGALNAQNAGYDVITLVHDEIVCEVQEDFGDVKEFEKLICSLPKWAGGIPLAAEGYEAKRYRK